VILANGEVRTYQKKLSRRSRLSMSPIIDETQIDGTSRWQSDLSLLPSLFARTLIQEIRVFLHFRHFLRVCGVREK
jgi:hypothetical protein